MMECCYEKVDDEMLTVDCEKVVSYKRKTFWDLVSLQFNLHSDLRLERCKIGFELDTLSESFVVVAQHFSAVHRIPEFG
jgi:hypothetical protein